MLFSDTKFLCEYHHITHICRILIIRNSGPGYFCVGTWDRCPSSYEIKIRIAKCFMQDLKDFTTTENKFFLDNKPCQLWTKAQRFGDHLCLHHQGKCVTSITR
jgi:hypothetical protein